jgi:membrane protein implicated in regulation of membrane protease activity
MTLSPSLLWFLVGVVFLVAELSIPGFILIFFTAGSWIASIVTLFIDIELTGQILIFVISSLVLLFTLRKYGLKTFKGKTHDNLDNDYTESKIGKTAVVTKAISPHVPGEIRFQGSYWRAVAETEIEEGQSVLIENQESEDGLTFKVKPL